MILTGVEKIDSYLDGGIKRGSAALLNSDPGIDLVEFHLHLLRQQEDLKILYVVNNKNPSLVQGNLSKYGIENVYILDSFSGLMCLSSTFDCIDDPQDTKKIYNKLNSLVEAHDFDVIIFDSLTMLYDKLGASLARAFIKRVSDLAETYNFAPLFLFTTWDEDSSEINALRNLFDYIIDLKLHRKKLVGNEMINISKVAGKSIKSNNMPYKLVETGIRLYVPKIVVTGPYYAGKTTIIHALSTKAISVNREQTTVALDHGHIDYKGYSVDLFGTPGQKRFDPILKRLASEASGIILVVDSTSPDSFARANELINNFINTNIPLVVVANKQDLANALNTDEIKSKLDIDEDISVIGSSALKKENLDNVLQFILDQIFR